MSTTLTVEQRVAKGAALMDAKVPGWHERIDVASLNMDHCLDCIIGQIFGAEFEVGMLNIDAYHRFLPKIGLSEDVEGDYGFNISEADESSYDPYEELRSAWLSEIDCRLEKGGAS